MASAQILVLEPFGARASGQGSHAAFINGWQQHSSHQFHVLQLPGVHWKWRSRHSAWTFAQQSQELLQQGRQFDLVFCSEMLNVAEWRGLAPPALSQTPVLTYFHENQFTYPLPPEQKPDYHLAYNNVLSAIASDAVWFNSQFHLEAFASAADLWLKRMPDFQHRAELRQQLSQASVAFPGISPNTESEQVPSLEREPGPLRIGWVSRWEHDKRPDLFLQLIQQLLGLGFEFELILLGQQFTQMDTNFDEIHQLAGNQIRHSGYAETREDYTTLLADMDVVVSTADHENFGIGIVEAIAHGAVPLLPNKLAYPEVLAQMTVGSTDEFLYEDLTAAASRIQQWSQEIRALHGIRCTLSASPFFWSTIVPDYDQRINDLLSRTINGNVPK